jgi:hypothetical protein
MISNNYGRLQVFIWMFIISTGKQKKFFEIYRQFGQASPVWFASLGPIRSGYALDYRQPQFAVSCPQMDRNGVCAVRLRSSVIASREI